MKVTPYLNFEGRCEEALAFYETALGAKILMMSRFNESPDRSSSSSPTSPGEEAKVMHAAFLVGKSEIMASDGRCNGNPSFRGVLLSIEVADVSEADTVFKALADGGTVSTPLSKTFFAEAFGIVVDRFGVVWMIMAPD